jgi:hypothetical protein
MTRYACVVLVVVGLAGCGDGEEGGLPPIVIEMYDQGAPDGVIEIEAERDGTIIEIEVGIDPAKVPQAIRDAADRDMPGGEVKGAELEYVGGKKAYEIKKSKDGLDYELVYDEAGTLIEREAEMKRADAPAAVMAKAMAIVAGAEFKSVEKITRGEEATFHVKVTKGGASYKFVLEEDGTVVRKVREARAEIEIPMK